MSVSAPTSLLLCGALPPPPPLLPLPLPLPLLLLLLLLLPCAEEREGGPAGRRSVREHLKKLKNKLFHFIRPYFSSDGFRYAVCILAPSRRLAAQHTAIGGLILFRQKRPTSRIEAYVDLEAAPFDSRFHAIHIHEYGERFESCESTGPHFNPYNRKHPLHVGDLSNVYLKSNTTILFYPNVKGTFFGSNSLYGRSVVVSENEDDKGNGSNKLSELDGNSGRSLSCCTIAVADNFLWLNVVEKLRFPG
eukprot:gi/632944198/ref/XP_007887368.1/ PREDICTED: extracellular superoxide dismutase [Cu-Zn]-like [Callorhinchus milii]